MAIKVDTRFDPAAAINTPKLGTRRFTGVIAGPPGTGKSTVLGSMADVLGRDRVLLLATLAREAESWKYQQDPPLSRIIFQDSGWVPTTGKLEAVAFRQFIDTLEYLHDVDDQFDGVIVDSGTELAELGWHLCMLPHGVATPAEMDGDKSRFLPYESLDIHLSSAVNKLQALTKTAKRPKHVLVSWHVQAPKDDTTEKVGGDRVRKESADNAGKGVEYEGDVLPMVRGRFRRRVASQFDAMLYTEVQFRPIQGAGLVPRFMLQVRPNPERHSKFPGPLPPMTYLDVTDPINPFQAFLDLTEGRVQGASQAPEGEAPARRSLSRK